MTNERQQIKAGIAALEAQRALLGDAVVDAALAALRPKLATLAEAAPEADQVLKQVAILFMDVVGSTALSQRLHPEEIAAVMDEVLARGTTVVEGQGGKVLNYAGDNLLGAFGADTVREDDAERAIRAGLALLALGREFAETVKARYDHEGLDVRIGIHTGGVLLGGGVGGEASIRGQAVNIAARMEQTAPPGGLRISQDTYRQVRGVFDVAEQAPIEVKGVDQPVQSYLVLGAKARAFRVATKGIEGVATRMIGRDAEFEVLQAAFKRLFTDRSLAAVSVVGEAGVGKSRLVYEFSNWAEARPEPVLIFEGRATPQTPDQPYGLLRDVIAWCFEIADGDSMDAAKTKLEAGLVPLFGEVDGEPEADAHLLGYLIGLDYAESRHIRGIREDQRQIRNRAFHAGALMFRRIFMQREMPIMLLLEDLHWADDPSLEFLTYLALVAKDVPLLVLGVIRPALFERRQSWIGAAPHHRIDLAPFGREYSRELANELLKKLPEIPSALRELVAGGAEGNPFYMEELVKMLIDQHAIDTSGEVWCLDAGKLLAAKVPPTLTGVLQARLDGLPADERRALQEASVIGLIFWDQALAALDPAACDALPDLMRKELALPRQDAAFVGMREYEFKHQILHRVTYETLLKRARRDLHGRAARWFAGLTDARASDFLAVAAQHYAQAGEAAAACEHYTRAAEHARTRYANDEALDLVAKALALLPEVPEDDRAALHWRLLDARERTYEMQGRRDEQLADLEALDELAATLCDKALQPEIAWRRAHRARRMGDYSEMKVAAQRSHDLALAAGDVPRRLNAQHLLAKATLSLGDVPAGQALAESGLEEARALGLLKLEGEFLNSLGLLGEITGDLAGFFGFALQNLEVSLALGDRRSEIVARLNLASSWTSFGLFGRAREEASEVLRLAQALGDRYFEGAAHFYLAHTALLQCEDAQALAEARAALAAAAQTQTQDGEVSDLLILADAELALGRMAPAEASFQNAEILAVEIGRYLADARSGRARAALAKGDVTVALDCLAAVLTDLEGGSTLQGAHDHHLVRLTCWRTLDAANDPRAAWMLDLAHREVQKTAGAIGDAELRQSFLTNHPTHRAIIDAWSAAHPGG